MAPSSGLSVLTKALHAATGPESSKSSSATTTSTSDSASSPSLSHTASEFGRQLKHALHEEWNKTSNPPRVSRSCRSARVLVCLRRPLLAVWRLRNSPHFDIRPTRLPRTRPHAAPTRHPPLRYRPPTGRPDGFRFLRRGLRADMPHLPGGRETVSSTRIAQSGRLPGRVINRQERRREMSWRRQRRSKCRRR